ncbi:TRAP transporter small permease [Franzmannia qiaohouensis]|uniref:TRAP transporter small permease protein n=1 Tax=Franzmannia qiaohouensis TaxID=1329370 RepID=A0ABU1HJ09_9GAMM|nr:TRAP transporter small permease [Halomonas qiaohouensis]MDR5907480.1 TRAP transporter small permease [Halomonas qiaohouensis]
MLIMIVAVGGEVLLRLVFRVSVGGTSEVARFSFVWLTFIGSVCAFRHRQHLSINLISDQLSLRAAKALDTLLCLLILVGCYYLVVYGLALTQRGWNQTSPTLGIRMGLVYSSIPISASLIAMYALCDVVRQSVEIWRGEDHKPIGGVQRKIEEVGE